MAARENDALGLLPAAPDSTRIRRRSLHDEVVERLRDMIVEGELDPGSRIAERALCERFDISRTPLREALKVLAREGLVELAPNRGARVGALAERDIEELFEVLGVLEALAGERAAARISPAELAPIRDAQHAMVACWRAGDMRGYFKLNQEIHGRILAASGSATLQAAHEGLAGRVRHARYIANLSPERWCAAVEEHAAILAALEAGDGLQLAALLRAHLRHKGEVVKAAFLAQASRAG